MKESWWRKVVVSFSRVIQFRRNVPLICLRLKCLRAQRIANKLPMQRLQSYYSTCAHGCSTEFMYCDNAHQAVLTVIGVTLEQTPPELSVLSSMISPLGELPCNGVSLIYIYTPVIRLCYWVKWKKYICRIMRVTRAIISIYNLMKVCWINICCFFL